MNIFKKVKNSYNKHREVMRSLSDDDVLMIARENNGRLTTCALSRQTNLSYIQASIKLQMLYYRGYFKINYNAMGSQIMVLKSSEQKRLAQMPKIRRLSQITDAEVLKVALENRGVLTPASLCIAIECSVEVAQQKLDELQLQDIFKLEIADNGTILYMLNDIEHFQPSTQTPQIG